MSKKITVLKSLRTEAGAKDWLKIMKVEDAKVVDSVTLKHMYDDYGYDMPVMAPAAHHVVLEEDLSTVVEVIDKGEVGEVIKALVDKGFAEIDVGGLCFTEKWYGAINSFISDAVKDSMKSTGEAQFSIQGEFPENVTEVFRAINTITKAISESSEVATENAEFGHELRDNTAISDEEAQAAFDAKSAPEADVSDSKMDGEELSDSEVEAAIHEGGPAKLKSILYTTFKSVAEARAWTNPDPGVYHVVPVEPGEKEIFGEESRYVVRGRSAEGEETLKLIEQQNAMTLKSSHGKHPNDVTEDDVQGTAEPTPLQDEEAEKATTFKSLAESRAWKNPNPKQFVVRPTNFDEKKLFGRNAAYIVDRLPATSPTGAYGNRLD